MKKLALIAAALIAGFVSIACNTVHGLGQDIEKAGSTISGASK